jgi:hypothetical protein
MARSLGNSRDSKGHDGRLYHALGIGEAFFFDDELSSDASN